ncbi:hypothetical protein [Bacillus mycoides]|uniref:hypothetical protein n=1 Tax=Bacillus mycoides TaxID=1405 RepID=UPI003D07E5C7
MEDNFNVQLSPPWITYFNEIKYSVGIDPDVAVGPLIPVDGNYIILIKVVGDEKAVALATLLKPTMQFGNINVEVVVSNNENQIVSSIPCPLDAFEIAHLFQVALGNNPYFQEVVVQPQLPGGQNVVFPVFKPEVIQFFNDDISNLCQTFTAVASDVFSDVMKDAICDIPILFSTSCDDSIERIISKENIENTHTVPKLFY